MRRLWLLLLAITFSRSVLPGQQPSLAGPVEGFTFDAPTQSFRAVIGLPGSSILGPTLATGFDTGSVGPHVDYAIAFQQGACLLVSSLNSGQVSSTPLDGANGQPDAIVWSGDGSVAILFSRSGNWLQVLSGLPSAPQFALAVDLSSLGGTLAAVAADQHGQNIAVAVQGANGGIFMLNDTGSFTSLFQTPLPRALAFSYDGSTLYVLDEASPQLTVLTVQDGGVQVLPLDGMQDPAAIGSGRDSQGHEVVYIAGGEDQILRLYDPAAQQFLMDLPLDFTPTGIAPLGRFSFVLAARAQASDPLWIFADAPQPAVYFVPAAQPAGGLE